MACSRTEVLDIPADNIERANKFYTSIFGWEIEKYSMSNMEYYGVCTVKKDKNNMPIEKGAINGGMQKKEKTMPHPVLVINVKNIDKSMEKFFAEGRKLAAELDRGIFRKRTPTLSFANFEIYMRTLTPKRLELLSMIKARHPKTIKELSVLAQRDFKNVYQDVQLLKIYDLVKLKKIPQGLMPVLGYDEIQLDIKIPLTA